jgi:hydrogenase maturation protein HypF
VLGVAFDGTGLGSDGSIWGGEILLADLRRFERVAHLRPVPMPGGERAVLEPWRMALAHLRDAGVPADALSSIEPGKLRAVTQLIDSGAFSPLTSSAGRLFDAVAAIAGVRRECHYDGQPAIELEWAAERAPNDSASYEFALERPTATLPWVIDTRPVVREIAEDVRRGSSASVVARRFHTALAGAVVTTLELLRAEHGLGRVVLGGGVFANGLLLDALSSALPARGFELYRPERYPPGDGGLCLGQLAVAAARTDRGVH